MTDNDLTEMLVMLQTHSAIGRLNLAECREVFRVLQAHSPLERLSNMEARTVFEFMQQRGFQITKVANNG